jgi:uncharacterized protein YmfQ (DUF2313 family)
MYSADAYALQLQQHLPTGAAWPRDRAALLTLLMGASAQEFARFDERTVQFEQEFDPRSAYELLPDWERLLGLPDPCTAAATSIAARQSACWRKLAFQAGQTPEFYTALAASIGYDIVIHEFDPDVDDYDGSLTSQITGGRYRYVWRVEVLNAGDYSVFRFGDPFGGRFAEGGGGAVDLECVLNAAKPAHTHVIFSYPEA